MIAHIVVTLDHGAKADAIAETVSRLVGVDEIAIIIDLYLHVLLRRLACTFLLPRASTSFFARGRLTLAYGARPARVGSNNAWRRPPAAFAGLPRLRDWGIPSGASASRSLNRERRSRLLTGSFAA